MMSKGRRVPNALSYHPAAALSVTLLTSDLSYSQRATSEGLGEPLNAVVSSDSDPFVLTQAGLVDWLYSIQYSQEYGGISIGGPQAANLGDGQGLRELGRGLETVAELTPRVDRQSDCSAEVQLL